MTGRSREATRGSVPSWTVARFRRCFWPCSPGRGVRAGRGRWSTPGRIAVLPPDVFVVLDQVGDDDPVKSAAIGQAVSAETMRAIDRSLRNRGYDVNLLPRWDGVYGPDGTPVPGGEARYD